MAQTSFNSGNRSADLSSLPDHEIMERLKTAPHDEVVAGFEILVRRYKNAIVSYTFRFVGDYRTAEDLSQEAFLRVFRKIGEYNSTAKFSTWLYTIAGNIAKDELKRRVRHPAKSMDWASGKGADTTRNVPSMVDGEQPAPDQSMEQDEMRQTVNQALNQLKEDDREILLLKDVQGLPYEEVAQILELPMGTVKSRISRARLAFKEVWKSIGA